MLTLKQWVPRPLRSARRHAVSLIHRMRWANHMLPQISFEEATGLAMPKVAPEPILDDICMPPHFQEDHDDFGVLMGLLEWKKPRKVLELGTAHGNTVANACRLLPDAVVYTVDAPVEEQTGSVITYGLRRDEIGRVYRTHGYGDRVTQIYANTLHLDLSDYLAEAEADFAIIDACHDTDFVLNDFKKIVPYIRPDGIVLMHDTHPSMRSHLLGSYRACLKLRQEGYSISHILNTWWGIWVAPE